MLSILYLLLYKATNFNSYLNKQLIHKHLIKKMNIENQQKINIEISKSETYELNEVQKEEKLVNLLTQIIVALTIKQYYEKSDTIP